MNIRPIVAALAGVALLATGQALAQGRGGGHGGGQGQGIGAGGQGRGHVDVGVGRDRIDTRVDTRARIGTERREEARARARARERANQRAIDRANENSVLRSDARVVTDLSLLRVGQTMRTSTGTEIGIIRRVNRSPDGTVRNVLVRSATGMRTIPVAPGTLTIDGDIVTTLGVRPRGGR